MDTERAASDLPSGKSVGTRRGDAEPLIEFVLQADGEALARIEARFAIGGSR